MSRIMHTCVCAHSDVSQLVLCVCVRIYKDWLVLTAAPCTNHPVRVFHQTHQLYSVFCRFVMCALALPAHITCIQLALSACHYNLAVQKSSVFLRKKLISPFFQTWAAAHSTSVYFWASGRLYSVNAWSASSTWPLICTGWAVSACCDLHLLNCYGLVGYGFGAGLYDYLGHPVLWVSSPPVHIRIGRAHSDVGWPARGLIDAATALCLSCSRRNALCFCCIRMKQCILRVQCRAISTRKLFARPLCIKWCYLAGDFGQITLRSINQPW